MYVLLTNLQTATHIACMLSSPKSPEPTWRVLVCFMLPFGGQPTQKILFRTTPHDALSLEVLKTRAGPGLSCVQAPTANIGQPIRTYTATYAVCHAAFDRMTLESMGDCGGRHARFGFRDAKLVPEMHGTRPFASRKPTCAGSPRILLFYYYSTTTPAVCISETDLRRFTQDFTILLFYYYSTTTPAVASLKPTCAGSPRILLFYYFAILLFQYCTILLCTILLLTIPIFTILPRPQPFASR